MSELEQISLDNWEFAAVFHNLHISNVIKTKYALVIPHNDHSLNEIRAHSKNFTHFVDSFTDHCGREVHPSLLFFQKRVPAKLEAMIAFRNILAISTIIKTWEIQICHDAQLNYFKYSDYFNLHPYSLRKGFKHLFAYTPSLQALDDPLKFQGQCSPEIATARLSSISYDKEVFGSLLNYWSDYHITKKKREWLSTALFRSLEMAYRASSLPFSNQSTVSDYGANLGLWISAFEILVHPEQSNVNKDKVVQFLDRAEFYNNTLTHKRYKKHKGATVRDLNLIQKTYLEMNNSRNTFLHGNKIKACHAFPGGNTKAYSLFLFAPIIYKCALHVFLNLGIRQIDSNNMENLSEKEIEHMAEIIKHRLERDDFENALASIRSNREEHQ